jgi:amino acid transporter
MEKKEAPPLFLRKATGVVRAWSPVDGWMYNVIAINPVIMIALTYVMAAWLFPGGDMVLAIIICGIFCTFEAVVQAALNSTLPRSGGDYVFQSRIWHGLVACIFAWTGIVAIEIVWNAIAAWFGANICLSPFFVLLGYTYNNPALVNFGTWLATSDGIWFVGILTMLWAAIINIAGMKWYARLQRIFFAVGFVGMAIIMAVLVSTTVPAFTASFNAFFERTFGVSNAYQAIIDSAITAGFNPTPPPNFADTVAIIPLAAFSLIYPNWAAAQAGEIKKGESFKHQLFQTAGCEIFSFLYAALIAFLLIQSFGLPFLASSGYIYYENPGVFSLPVPPFFGFYVATIIPSVIWILLVAITFNAWHWMWFTNIDLAMSRVMLAMSFDRIHPEKLGEVHPKTRTPINAIIMLTAWSLLAAWAYAYTDFWRWVLSSALVSVVCFAVSVLGGALLPWLKRDLYKSSPALKYYPIVTVSGLIFFGFTVWLVIEYLTVPAYGLTDPLALTFIASLYVVGALIYFFFKWYRKRQGIDIDLIHKEIPYA